jgi:hypothetical protein
VEDLVGCLDDLSIVRADSQQRSREQVELMPGDCAGPLKKGKADGDFCAVRQREGSASTVSARCGIAKNVLAWDDAVADRAYKREEANEIEIGNFNAL